MVEVEFRDGKRMIPEYLADIFLNIDTVRVTFEQAVEFANRWMLADHVNQIQKRVIADHFKELRN